MANSFGKIEDVVIIGGGPGGYEAALSAAQLGANVSLIERTGIGGAAVLTDVVPSKTLIATAEAYQAVPQARQLGIEIVAENGGPVRLSVDFGDITRRIKLLAGQQSRDMRDRLERAGVRVYRGTGRLNGHHDVVATFEDGREIHLHADTTIVATGATPRQLATAKPDGERILTWTQLYDLEDLPEHLIVVGSGVTGAEFASAFRALGSEVTLISSRDRVLPGEDEDAALVIESVFRRNGMQVLSRSRAQVVERTEDGVVAILADGRRVEGSHCLMAVGAIPNTKGLGLEEAGVVLTDTGHIKVNRVARTSVPEIYAVGDCSDFMPLASVATMQGRTAVFHAMGDEVYPTRLRNVAANIFTSPEIATVGWSQAKIEEGLAQGEIVKVDLASNPRAKMQGIEDGFVKIFARPGSGSVLGGVVVAPKASELIFPIALAVEHRLTVDDIAKTFSVYPSLTGAISDASRAMHLVRH